MAVRTEFPHQIRVLENVWIPLSDGCRLAARIWLPLDAEPQPVPAILEYIPYRKDDGTARRDAERHPYFAGHGYAAVRVDLRGSGDSDGILYDEYLAREQDDALEALAWIAAQPWCTGMVGMLGISWGGFNGLHVAARRPPQLKAVISVCSTDDRYADDVHYTGGCLNAADQLLWAAIMLALNARPPIPSFAGPDWRAKWLDRLERTPPHIEPWMAHQRRDTYWQHGSVCEDYAAIECPVYVVGGWADGYTNAIPRLLAGLRCPRKGLIGPWAHTYPEFGVPGPAIGFLQESLRWWDHWLKGVETGIMDEPQLRAWLNDAHAPEVTQLARAGRWVAEPAWPPATARRRFALNPGALADTPEPEVRLSVGTLLAHGQDAGAWCPYGAPGDFPPDQRAEDGRALCFDSAPLAAPLDLLGYPELTLTLAADQPLALLSARLCAVAPDGASTLLSRGLLNLTHRASDVEPLPLTPGERYTVTLRLNALGYALPLGTRLRLALAPAYWPHAWPSPDLVTLTVFTGDASALTLPERPPRPDDARLPPFEAPEAAPSLEVKQLRSGGVELLKQADAISGELRITLHGDQGRHLLVASGIEYEACSTTAWQVSEGQPLSASVRCAQTIGIAQGAMRTRVETLSTLSADAEQFYVTNTLDAYEGETRVFVKTWDFSVARDLV